MSTAINKKRITIYAVCAILFVLAGIFQAVDSKLPEFWHALFALTAHTILLSLVIVWGISLIHRMVRKDLLSFFITIAVLILFFLVIRMIKYGLTEESDALSRYIWYGYYIPQCLIPPTLLLAALSLENKKGKPINNAWYLLYLPALILIAIIYTNDLHEQAFALNFDGGEFSYTHRAVFYVALFWEIAVSAASLAVMIFKCGVSACKKRTWIPVCVLVACAVISVICYFTNTSAYKIPELLCFTCIVLIESCVLIGLIPSNENYENYFCHSAYSAVITDEDFNVIYNSETPLASNEKTFKAAAQSPVMTEDDARIVAAKIHGGYVFRKEDLSHINKINAILKDVNEQIAEENYLIEAENAVKEQKAKIDEQNKLYLKIAESTKRELDRLGAFLKEVENGDLTDKTEFAKKMRFACVMAVFIKRRSNLIMLSEKNDIIDVGELSLCIKESLDYLSLMGADCSYDCELKGEIGGKTAGALYDFFEECVARCDNLPTALMIRLQKSGDKTVLRIESDSIGQDVSAVLEELETAFPNYRKDMSVETDGEAVYYTLALSSGGGL